MNGNRIHLQNLEIAEISILFIIIEYYTRACYTVLAVLGILLQRYFGARCRDFGDMPAGFLADCVTRISLGSLPG
jgi:hypothetical protein